MGSKPKAPQPTEAEVQLQQRQREDLARLDEEENIRLKRGLRGRLGSRRLLSTVRRAGGNRQVSGGSVAAAKGPGGPLAGTRRTGGQVP